MTAPFPHTYRVGVEYSPKHGGRASAPPRPVIVGGAPPEFDGHDGWWSPEHLLLSSTALCFALTFESLARRAQWPYERLDCEAEGVLDRTPEGLRFVRIILTPKIEGGGEEARGRSLLESAKKHCIVANSLKADVVVLRAP